MNARTQTGQLTTPGLRLRLGNLRDYGIVAAFVGLLVTLTFASDAFLTATNLRNIADQWSPTMMIAVAGTLVFIAGGFDLSVGAVFALAGVVTAMVQPEVGTPVALVIGCLVGLAAGTVNGVLATVGRINPFMATLATSTAIGGVAVWLTGGDLVPVTDPGFSTLGLDRVLGLNYSVWICAVFVGLCALILHRSVIGRFMYAVGGNLEAARLAGVRVHLVQLSTYVISGLAAGIAGVIATSQISTGQADAGGLNLTLDVITAIVLGGTSLTGGRGAVWRTMLGVLILALLGNGFNVLGVEPTIQQVVKGMIILLAVGLDAWTRRS